MHAIATMCDQLREQSGERGLIWANGGFTTKHAFGVYSCRPGKSAFEYADPQGEIDKLPKREVAGEVEAAGDAVVESYTVMHDRNGNPELAIATCLLPSGKRAWGTSDDSIIASAMCKGEWVGRTTRLDSKGKLSFT